MWYHNVNFLCLVNLQTFVSWLGLIDVMADESDILIHDHKMIAAFVNVYVNYCVGVFLFNIGGFLITIQNMYLF